MLRLLILISLCAASSASLMPNYHPDYLRSLQRLFSTKRESVVEEKKNDREVCNTEECKLIAKVIKDSMDASVNPCDDFYDYACGKWSNLNPVPENMTEWSLWKMVLQKIEKQVKVIITSESKPDDLFALKLAKKWYRSCTDTEGIERRGMEPLLSTLWRHGGWPIIMEDGEWDDEVYNWQIVDDQFARLLGFNAFHDLRYDSLSYEDNETIQIDTPHLPLGVQKLLSIDILSLFDSSDENNESGEGSQERGSREKGQQKGNDENDDEDEENSEEENEEDEDEDEDEDDESNVEYEEESEDWDTAESEERLRNKKVVNKKVVGKSHSKKLSHIRRKQNSKKGTNGHVRVHKKGTNGHVRVHKKGTKKRTRREIMKQNILRRFLRRLKKSNHEVRHSVSKKLSNRRHLSHSRQSKRGNDIKSKVAKKHSNKKKMTENDKKDEELRKKKTEKKIAKRLGHGKKKNDKSKVLGKHVHERKKSKRPGMETKVRVAERRKDRKVTKDRKGKKMNSSNGVKVTYNEVDTSNDEENDNSDNNEVNEDYDNYLDYTTEANVEQDNDENDDEYEENDEDTKETNEEKDNDENDDEHEETNEDTEDTEGTDEETDNDEEDDDDDSNDDDNDDSDYDEEDAEKIQMLREEYRDYILNVSILLSKERGIEIPREQMMEDANDLVEFIVALGELLLLFGEDEPMNTTLEEFNTYYESLGPLTKDGTVNWIRKVQKVFSEAGVEIEDDVEIVVTSPVYIEVLQSLLDITPARVLVNYIHWNFISKAVLAGPEKLKTLGEEWNALLTSTSRESLCLELVQLTNVAGYEYVKRYFSESVAKSARDMIDDIQKEVEYQIKASSWMNDDTKHFVLDKLVHMKNWVGYPDWYQNITMVKRYFRGLTIGTSFYENILNYIRHLKWKSLRRIVSNDEINDLLDPLELNAFFLPTENSISITAVDFQSPFFAPNRPWYVNFGIIGYIMAHEVNHGFDDSGHLYDKEGNQMEWLSAMAEAYNKRAKCFVDQYNKYSILKEENYTIEDYGNQTAGENIADTMGLHTVYNAYKRRERECGKVDSALPGLEKFTNDQAFFLSFANLWCETEDDRETAIRSAKYDVHSTGRLRVIGSVSNLKEFSEAFNCPLGSPMNPKKKCNIWK